MPILEWKEKDFGTPYKTFNGLSEGDEIWVVNLMDMSVMGYPVVSVVVSMARVLQKRCSIQWEIFKGMFGPATDAVMPRDIRLR